MKKLKTHRTLAMIVLILAIAASSCRKTTPATSETMPESVLEQKFFNTHRSSSAEENAIVDAVKRFNNIHHFVEKTSGQIGFPRWDKIMKVKANLKSGSVRTASVQQTAGAPVEADRDIYYVPFVRDSQNYVNATMVINTSGKDTSFNYICDWQYRSKKHGDASGPTAEGLAVFFMMLDNRTFGQTEFDINDLHLFPRTAGKFKKKFVFLNKPGVDVNGRSLSSYHQVCVDFYVCGAPDWCADHGGCDYLNCAAAPGTYNYCYTVKSMCESWWDTPGSGFYDWNGGGAGDPGAGSGGQPGGGQPPSPCDPYEPGDPNEYDRVGTQSGRVKTNPAPCNPAPGWSPSPTFDPNDPFADITNPFAFTEENVIENGVDISNNLTGPGNGTPRVIGGVAPRNRVEDMQYGTNGDGTGISPVLQGMSDDALFLDMKDLFYWCTFFSSDLQTVGYDMIQKFKNNQGGEYRNTTLNDKVANSSEVLTFLKRFGSSLNEALRTAGGDINQVPKINMSTSVRPIFNGGYNKFHGLQILINDTESTEIQLDNFYHDPVTHKWTAEVTVTIRDHFGLDKNDALTYQGKHSGFGSWWILQHQRGYRPLETVITFKKAIHSQY